MFRYFLIVSLPRKTVSALPVIQRAVQISASESLQLADSRAKKTGVTLQDAIHGSYQRDLLERRTRGDRPHVSDGRYRIRSVRLGILPTHPGVPAGKAARPARPRLGSCEDFAARGVRA